LHETCAKCRDRKKACLDPPYAHWDRFCAPCIAAEAVHIFPQEHKQEDANAQQEHKLDGSATGVKSERQCYWCQEDANTCVVCQEAARTHICYPCGHLCMCAGCATSPLAPKTCPCCRTEIVNFTKVYHP
jgi:hypothetical protein